jgi:hypothetical protein
VLVLELDVVKSPHPKHLYDARPLGFHDLLYEPTKNKGRVRDNVSGQWALPERERDNRLPLSELNLGDLSRRLDGRNGQEFSTASFVWAAQ